ncbi:MAG: transcriptional regulator NrdR [Gammaproteobacteria bacterium]
MYCPFCGKQDTRVIDSRLASEGAQVRRRRECNHCGERFTTFESPELVMPRIIKSNGAREPYDEAKLTGGVMRALEKRPVESERVDAAMTRLQHRLRASGEREIPARQLGEWVMNELRQLDQVAYVRFASVYRSFEDVNAFREEIEKLESEPTAEERKDQISLLPDE